MGWVVIAPKDAHLVLFGRLTKLYVTRRRVAEGADPAQALARREGQRRIRRIQLEQRVFPVGVFVQKLADGPRIGRLADRKVRSQAVLVRGQGEELAAVGTFHGSLGSSFVAKKGFKPRVLVMTGAADPMIGPDAVAAFRKEMTDAGARFDVQSYPGAKHGFTNPDADKAGIPGLGYSESADKASWAAWLALLAEVFPASR